MSHNGSHIAAPSLAIAFHSGFGHTAVLADAVAAGARRCRRQRHRRRPHGGSGLGHPGRRRRHRIRHRDLHGQPVCRFPDIRRTNRPSVPRRNVAGQGRGRVHQFGCQERRQARHLVSLAVFAASTTCTGSTWVWPPVGTAPAAARPTSTASASGWAWAHRPMSTPARSMCTAPTCRRAATSAPGHAGDAPAQRRPVG
jgi:hypothetical protein